MKQVEEHFRKEVRIVNEKVKADNWTDTREEANFKFIDTAEYVATYPAYQLQEQSATTDENTTVKQADNHEKIPAENPGKNLAKDKSESQPENQPEKSPENS